MDISRGYKSPIYGSGPLWYDKCKARILSFTTISLPMPFHTITGFRSAKCQPTTTTSANSRFHITNLPTHTLSQILARVHDHDPNFVLSFQMTCRKMQKVHPHRELRQSIASLLPTEIIQLILSDLDPISFDSARQTCRSWRGASYHKDLLTAISRKLNLRSTDLQLRPHNSTESPDRQHISAETSRLLISRLSRSLGSTNGSSSVDSNDSTNIEDNGSDAWSSEVSRLEALNRVIADKSRKDVNTWRPLRVPRNVFELAIADESVISTDGLLALTIKTGKVYSMYNPKSYHEQYYKASFQPVVKKTPPRIKRQYPPRNWVGRVNYKLSREAFSGCRDSGGNLNQDVTPHYLFSLPSINRPGRYVKAAFIDTPSRYFSTEIQIATLVESSGRFEVTVFFFVRNSAGNWKVSSTVSRLLHTQDIGLFAVSPVVDISESDDDSDTKELSTYIATGSSKFVQVLQLSIRQSQRQNKNEDGCPVGPKTINRYCRGFALAGSHRLRDSQTFQFDKFEWLPTHYSSDPLRNPSSRDPTILVASGQGRSCLFKFGSSPESMEMSRILGEENEISHFWPTRMSTVNVGYSNDVDIRHVSLNEISLVSQYAASRGAEATVKPKHEDISKSLVITASQEGSSQYSLPEYHVAYLSVPTDHTLSSVGHSLIRLCRLHMNGYSKGVDFAGVSISEMGTYVAGIFQPGDQIWVWVAPTAFNTHQKQQSESQTPVPVEQGKSLGSFRGAKSVRWDWRPYEGITGSGTSGEPGSLSEKRMVLNLMIGTSSGSVFALDFSNVSPGCMIVDYGWTATEGTKCGKRYTSKNTSLGGALSQVLVS